MKMKRNRCVLVLGLLFLLAMAVAEANPSNQNAPAGGQQSATVVGEWQGAIARQHLLLKITQSADSRMSGALISVDQGDVSIPIDIVSLDKHGVLHLELKRVVARFTLKPRDQGGVALQPSRTADGNVEALCGSYQVHENRPARQDLPVRSRVPSACRRSRPSPPVVQHSEELLRWKMPFLVQKWRKR